MQFCTRVMIFDLRQNFVSPQYLENKLTEIHQILNMHSYRCYMLFLAGQELAWDCYTPLFALLYRSYGPLFMSKFRFRSITCEQIDRISPNFIYAFILTRSSL